MVKTTALQKIGFSLRFLVLTHKNQPGVFVWCALFFVLYGLGIGFLLPYWALPTLERELSDALGTNCTIQRLTANPFTLKITARNVVIPYPKSIAPRTGGDFIRLKRLEAVAALSSITNKALVINELRLIRPEIHVTRLKDDTLSPQLFFADKPPTKTAPEIPPPKGNGLLGDIDLFPAVIHNLTMREGTLTIKDEVHGTSHSITDIDLSVPFVSTLVSHKNMPLSPRLSAIVSGKPVVITGESRPFTRTRQTVFTLKTDELDLPEFRKYLVPYTNLSLQSGKLRTALTLHFSTDAQKAFDFSLAGTAEIVDLTLAGKNGTVFKTTRALLDMESVLLGPRRITINNALLENPEVTVRRFKNGSVDWGGFFPIPDDSVRSEVVITTGHGAQIPKLNTEKSPAAEQKNEEIGLPLLLAIANARVTNGKIIWHDSSLKTPVSYTLENVNTTFADISTEKEGRADFTITFGSAKTKTSFSATGKATATPFQIEATVNANNFPLAPFSEYISEGTGFVLNKGAANLSGNIAFSYAPIRTIRFTKGSASLVGAQVRSAKNTQTSFLDLQRIEATNVNADLAKRTVHIDKVSGVGIGVNLLRGKNGEILLPNPDTQTRKGTTKTSAERKTQQKNNQEKSTAQTPQPWQMSIDVVKIVQSRFSLVDTSLKNKAVLSLTNLSLTGKNFSTHGKRQWAATVTGKPGARGIVTLAAQGGLSPLNLTFSGKIDKADMRPLSPYLLEHSHLTLSEATLGGDFKGAAQLVPNSKRGGEFTLNGNLGLYGITLVHGQRELGGWGRMRVENVAYRAPARGGRYLSVGSVTVNNPRLSVTIDEKGVSSIAQSFIQSKASATSQTPARTNTNSSIQHLLTSFDIGSVVLSEGQANYRDMRVTPPYVLKVDKVATTLKNLSLNPGKESSISASLLVNGSPVTASGVLASALTAPSGQGEITVRSLDISRFTQYGEKYLGYPVKRGELTADITASLRGRKLNMQNDIIIRKLDLGKKTTSPNAPDLPLAAAVSILSDRNGDIHLTLPVSGTLGDPEFKLGGVVGKLIGTLVVKTVTSPITILDSLFSSVAGLFSSGPTQAEIVFPVGEVVLDKAALSQLKKIGKELKKRPSITVRVTGTADKGEESVLIDAWVIKSLREMKYNTLPAEQKVKTSPDKIIVSPDYNVKEYADLLFALYASMSFVKNSNDPAITSPPSTRALMRILRSHVTITDKELLLLADMRALSVSAALAQGNPNVGARIKVQKSVIEDAGKNGGRMASYARIQVKK